MEILFLLPTEVEGIESKRISKEAGAIPSGLTVASGIYKSPRVLLQTVPGNVPDPYRAGSIRSAYASDARQLMAKARVAFCKPRRLVQLMGTGAMGGYDGNLIARVWQYAQHCASMVKEEPFDTIHAHDWVTYPAGMFIAAQTGKPLIVHVHATEFDRSGESPNPEVYNIEYQGMHQAAAVITVSHLTERIIVDRYNIAPHKVRVAHNGVAHNPYAVTTPVRQGNQKRT